MSKTHQDSKQPATESLYTLLRQLVHASLLAVFKHLPTAVIDRVITVCALFAMAAPLLLWISWSKTGFIIIIGTTAACVAIIWLLIWLYPEDMF